MTGTGTFDMNGTERVVVGRFTALPEFLRREQEQDVGEPKLLFSLDVRTVARGSTLSSTTRTFSTCGSTASETAATVLLGPSATRQELLNYFYQRETMRYDKKSKTGMRPRGSPQDPTASVDVADKLNVVCRAGKKF